MLIADRSIPVSLTVIFLNLKEKHLIYIIILQNLVMVAPSDSLWLLIRPFFKNCKLRAPPGNPGETLPPRPRVRPPHENSTSILQAFLLPKHVPHCLPVTARSSSPPSGQPAFARCTQRTALPDSDNTGGPKGIRTRAVRRTAVSTVTSLHLCWLLTLHLYTIHVVQDATTSLQPS